MHTAKNPAEFASRGLNVKRKNIVKRWFRSHAFLWQNQYTQTPELRMNDPEVKKQVVVVKANWNKDFKNNNRLEEAEKNHCIKFMIKFDQRLKNKLDSDTLNNNVLSVILLKEAEIKIVLMVQEISFGRKIDVLKSNGSSIIPKSSRTHKLDVFLDIRAILRIGGRLKNSFLSCNLSLKYPILLPKRH